MEKIKTGVQPLWEKYRNLILFLLLILSLIFIFIIFFEMEVKNYWYAIWQKAFSEFWTKAGGTTALLTFGATFIALFIYFCKQGREKTVAVIKKETPKLLTYFLPAWVILALIFISYASFTNPPKEIAILQNDLDKKSTDISLTKSAYSTQSQLLYDSHSTQIQQATTIKELQSVIDYQSTQLPTSTPTPDELIIESLNQFVTMINNGEIAKAYDTLFTQYYRDTHTWLDFEKYWGTQVKKISINIIVSPYIPEDNIVSETNVEITIIIEGREYDPDVFIWNICHYEDNNEWLINNLLGSGKDCIER